MNPLESEGKIFISYRRADSPGVAGRLADSLKAYFGEDRVFRDVGGIRAGAKFDEVIDKTLTGTDAVIVLIGPNWLNASIDEGATRRLDDPDDVLSREIEFALDSGVPVFPILVEDTRMPSRAELPEKLAALARLNGISITDERWEQDVTRLAKIVALDIPGSVAERKLARMRLIVLMLLLGVMVFSTIRFTWTAYGANFFMLSSQDKMTSTQVGDLKKEAVPSQRTLINLHLLPGKKYYADNLEGWTEGSARTEWHVRFEDIYGTRFRFFNPLASVINFIGIALSCFLLTFHLPHMDKSARALILAAVWIGLAGTVLFLAIYMMSGGPFDTIAAYAGSTIIITSMLVLMGLSGFKAR